MDSILEIERALMDKILQSMKPGKALILLGARRVGKSHLVSRLETAFHGKFLHLEGEDIETHRLLEEMSIAHYKRIFRGLDLLVIDEAQEIPDIGRKLKLMTDHIPSMKILATGSSSFNIRTKAGNPLTGRSITWNMFPVSLGELSKHFNIQELQSKMEEFLIYGMYPETLTTGPLEEKRSYLNEVANAYLLKDIFTFEDIRQTGKLMQLLKLLAYQVGSEVSLNELANGLGISKNTADKYIQVLEEAFVLTRTTGFNKNLRKEVVKSHRYYFWDNGIMNAVTGNFSPLALRQDQGLLWENFVVSEMIKMYRNKGEKVDFHFWRTYDQQELDMVIGKGKKYKAFEIKYRKTKFKIPGAFQKNYPEIPVELIHSGNWYMHLL